MDRNKQTELIVLSIVWFVAVMFQFIITDAIASHIGHHAITDMKDELLVGFGVCLVLTLGVCIFAKSRIELESAFIISVGMAVFLGFWPYLSVKDPTDWKYPIFLMECAPMCALLWKATYKWVIRVNNVETNEAGALKNTIKEVVKAGSPSKVIDQGQAVVKKSEEFKKEDNPANFQARLIEQKPEPSKEPPDKPIKTSIWRLDK